jgi:hypothetical protein
MLVRRAPRQQSREAQSLQDPAVGGKDVTPALVAECAPASGLSKYLLAVTV